MIPLSEVYGLIEGELEYAEKWDEMSREERPEKDSEKSVEFWLVHIHRYFLRAYDACGGTDKAEAMSNVRKLAALAVKAMQYHETPHRG
jgi:hypothetical protein